MNKAHYRQLEDIVRKNLDQRRMDGIMLRGELEEAAVSLFGGETIVIVTGFVIRDYMTGETDGPIGAVSLAGALENIGKKVVLVTDEYSKDMLDSCCRVKRLRSPIEVISMGTETLFAEDLLKKYNPTHIVAVERPGKSIDGRCYSMKGQDLSDIVPDTDILFEEARERGIATIAVGDGGNEIGMGKIAPYIKRYVYKGSMICASVITDFLIIAGVSNWGGHALAAALSIIEGKMLLHDEDTEKILFRRMIEAGAVDGCTKMHTMTVDGLSLEENVKILNLLRNTAEEALMSCNSYNTDYHLLLKKGVY